MIAAVLLEFVRGTRARKELGDGTWLGAFTSLVSRNRRRYGGYISHAAVVLLAIGVVGSSAYDSARTAHLQPGQAMSVGGYSATYLGTTLTRSPSHDALRGQFALSLSRASRSGSSRPARTTTRSSSSSRTRSESTPTGSAPRT